MLNDIFADNDGPSVMREGRRVNDVGKVNATKCESPKGDVSDITTNERGLKDDDARADPTQIGDFWTTLKRSSSNVSNRRHWEPSSDLDGARSSSPSGGISQLNGDSIFTSNDGSRASAPSSRHIGIIIAAISPMLTDDDRLFLNFYLTQVRPEHYFMGPEAQSFLHNDLLRRACNYTPLLHAVLAFASYIYSFKQPDGKLYTFLHYYQSSLTGLLASLQNSEDHSDAMLLTVMQLATFEEYLGDWVNLMVHLKAACSMIKSLYRPEEMTRDNLHQTIFFWVTRIDVEAANILGKGPLLEKEWYDSMEVSIRKSIQSDPACLRKKWMLCEFLFRGIGRSMATLISQTMQDSVPAPDFDRIAMIHETEVQVQACMREIDYMLSETVESQASGAALSETIPGVGPGGGTGTADPLFIEITRFRIGLKGINLLYQHHTGNVLQLQGRNEPTSLALELRQNIETICRCSEQPEDGLQSLQRSLTICVTFLPVDMLNVAWSRKMMAMAESQGYIFSQPLKEHLSARWSDPEVTRWWFPRGEGETQLLRETKEWAAEHSLGVEMTEDTTQGGTLTAR
ncbi:hypothetical protein KEM56_000346 [Ascosphaera pollenicola]|nr:hypothetical protein KEM56_000346 [Ascosphaera pollenicola]